MPTKYADIINYLDAIANNANANVANAPHRYWWHVNADINQPPLAYNDFVNGEVFGIGVQIIGTDSSHANPLRSAFFVLLSTPGGAAGYPQMPKAGPYITDADFSVQLPDGSSITGAQIQANMAEWLGNGYPEN
jgi:hypothetical protein